MSRNELVDRGDGTFTNTAPVAEPFDYQLGLADGFPKTRPATVVATPLMGVGGTTTWIIQTSRIPEQGDTIFLQAILPNGTAYRLPVPPRVADVIARQREQLTKHNRRAAARASAASRPTRSFTEEDRARGLATRRANAAKRRGRKARNS
jgi:hypothetical protein